MFSVVLLFDISSGRAVDSVRHSVEVTSIALNQTGPGSDRKLTMIDRNMDLFITPIHRFEPVKLATVCQCVYMPLQI